ncbi:MAG: hypothetical protein HLUCCA11_12905 [Phormidesmis priestleyi Ana]|uniref:Uncharacterized protein n=1 Tax=Phormidesmis priestleyi Ana TaxID=1666911 RepID=A0A0N8KMW0_9CYAN|nr:MAG: hypothetical protein HLUCCA11_12905 [Phormidesmis priestleyi Ana]
MVERPIKKSEREAAAKKAEPAPASNAPKPIKKADRTDDGESRSYSRDDEGKSRDKRKGKGKGKGRDKDDAPRTPVNPAFVRGPKPSAKVAEPEVAEVTEAEVTEATESTESTEATEATESTEATEATESTEAAEATEAIVEKEPAAEVPVDRTPPEPEADSTASESADSTESA